MLITTTAVYTPILCKLAHLQLLPCLVLWFYAAIGILRPLPAYWLEYAGDTMPSPYSAHAFISIRFITGITRGADGQHSSPFMAEAYA